MAASEDDAELAELRSAVLASLKAKSEDKRIEQASLSEDENSSQAEDDEDLEVLRLAALQTKKLSAFTAIETEDDGTYLPVSPDERLEVYSQRSNLIVIPLVHNENDLQTYPSLGEECNMSLNEHLPRNVISEIAEGSPQQSKRDDKFSRFKSDSDSDSDQSQSQSNSDEMDDSGNQSGKRSSNSDATDSEEDLFDRFSREDIDNALPSDADVSTGISSAETVLENKSLEGDASPEMNSVQEELIAEAQERSDKSPQQYIERSHTATTSPKELSPCKYSKDNRVDKKYLHSDLHRPLPSSFSPGKENFCGHTVDDSSSSQHKCNHTSPNTEDANNYSELLRFKECSDRDLGSSSRQSRHSHPSHNILDRRKHEVSNNLQRRSHSQSPLRFCGKETTEAKTYSRERSRSRSPLHAFHLPASRNTFSEDDKGCRQGYDLLLSKKNSNANVSEKEKNRLGDLIPIPDEATLVARRRKFESQEVNVSSAEEKRISLKHLKLKSDMDKDTDASAYPIFKELQDGEKRSIEKRLDNCSKYHSGSSVLENLSSEKDNGVDNYGHSDSDNSVQRTKRDKSFKKKTHHSSRTDGLVEKRNESDTFPQRKQLVRRRHDLGDQRDSNAKWSQVDGKKSLQEKLMSLAYGGTDNDAEQTEHFKNRDEGNENKKSLKYRLGPHKEDCKKFVSRTSREHERTFDANYVPYDPIAILKSVINDKKDEVKQTPVHLERYRHRMEKADSVPREDKMKRRSQSPQNDDSDAKYKRRQEGQTSSNVERKVLILKGEEEESLQKRLPVHLRIGEVKQHITVKKTYDCLIQQSNSKGSYQTERAKLKQQEETTSSECGSWEMSKQSRNNEPVSGLASQVAVPQRKEKAEVQNDVSTDKESELDERIRKIQEKNTEILRRKQEIEADKKKYG